MNKIYFVILLALLSVTFLATPANAQHCWWNDFRFECHPGWSWRDGREQSEERRQEWWQDRRHHDDEERWRPHKDERHRDR